MTGIIALWAAPRSRSTAFFRSMVEHGDVVALHEPLCNLVDFGETTVLDRVVRTPAELIEVLTGIARTRTVFFKDTTDQRYPEILADTAFLREAQHTFLIRTPAEVASSFYALKPDMRVSDIGIENQHEILEAVRVAGGAPAVVIDSADLVTAPEATMANYCAEVGLPFRPEALSWQAGARPEWERSDRWHQDVAASTGFSARTSQYASTVENDPRLAAFSAHHEPFYQLLRAQRLVTA
ncbi:hypothetical protein GCM10010435_25010 [Winogradskya consettensis]|uniref:Sulfotransferase family protein n=1 Tax=Winogradskya consettensis TaxID=113560 RepID=A0A919VLL8_9ACTN|nr:hypothetical protein [Actinoplanes consettensis]GIM67785.1 hypothetical protein Aco04nite_07800 [Actinoplanes consettensis]